MYSPNNSDQGDLGDRVALLYAELRELQEQVRSQPVPPVVQLPVSSVVAVTSLPASDPCPPNVPRAFRFPTVDKVNYAPASRPYSIRGLD